MCRLAIEADRLLRMAALRGDAFVAVGADNVLFAAVMAEQGDGRRLVESAAIRFPQDARIASGRGRDCVPAQPQQHDKSS